MKIGSIPTGVGTILESCDISHAAEILGIETDDREPDTDRACKVVRDRVMAALRGDGLVLRLVGSDIELATQ